MTNKQITDEYSAHMYWLSNLKRSVENSRLKKEDTLFTKERFEEILKMISDVQHAIRGEYAMPLGYAYADQIEGRSIEERLERGA